MVATVTGFAALFKDFGLSAATVQRDVLSHEQVSSLFWINVLVGLGITLALAAVAPAVAALYGRTELVGLTCALSVSFLLSASSAQHTALLRRQMRFGVLAAIDVAAMACGAAAAIVSALLGVGYWALVVLTLVQSVAAASGAWTASGWRPSRCLRRTGVRPLLRFGANVTGFNILNYFTRNFDNVLVGTSLGAAPLGLYSKAYGLLLVPIAQINRPLGAVALPALSRLQDHPERFRRYYERALGFVAMSSVPVVAYAFADAGLLVRVLLGRDWGGVVPVFRLLGPGALAGAVNVAPGWLCHALDRTERQVHWALVTAPLSVVAFLAGLPWGVHGIAIAFSVTYVLSFIAFVIYACRGTPVSASAVGKAVLRPLAAAAMSGAVVVGYRSIGCASGVPALDLLAGGMLFSVVYAGTLRILPGGRALFEDTMAMARSLRRRRSGEAAPPGPTV
jgi:PST family polysaccharide transporter